MTQIQYIIDLLKLINNGSAAGAAARSAGIAGQLSTLADSMEDLGGLLDQGGINDLGATQQFYGLLSKIVSIYNRVHDYLPDRITSALDQYLDQDTVDSVYYFLGTCEYLIKGKRGFDLLVSEDGVNFDVITRNGFGDPNNHGCRVFAITDAGLCIGTANPFYGTQLWRITDLNVEEPSTAPGTGDGGNGDTDTPAGGSDDPSGSGTNGGDSQNGGASVKNPSTGDILAAAFAAVAVHWLCSAQKIKNRKLRHNPINQITAPGITACRAFLCNIFEQLLFICPSALSARRRSGRTAWRQ